MCKIRHCIKNQTGLLLRSMWKNFPHLKLLQQRRWLFFFVFLDLWNFEVKPVYPMNAASNLNSLCCVAHIRGQSDFFWLLAWDNLCKAQHKHIRNEWSQEHPVKIQFLGQDRGLTFLHNPFFDEILTTPYVFQLFFIMPLSLSIFYGRPNCHDHTSLQSGKRFQRHTDIFVLPQQ